MAKQVCGSPMPLSVERTSDCSVSSSSCTFEIKLQVMARGKGNVWSLPDEEKTSKQSLWGNSLRNQTGRKQPGRKRQETQQQP